MIGFFRRLLRASRDHDKAVEAVERGFNPGRPRLIVKGVDGRDIEIQGFTEVGPPSSAEPEGFEIPMMQTSPMMPASPRMNQLIAESLIEEKHEWRRWMREIPAIHFPTDWAVTIIPPFGGAVVRFRVNDKVSVYLDCYDRIGCVGHPYWEIYPDKEGDTDRFSMNDVEELLEGIRLALERP